MGQRAGDLFDFICDEFKRDKNGVKLDKSSNKKKTLFGPLLCNVAVFKKRRRRKFKRYYIL